MVTHMNNKPASACRISRLLLGQILIDGEFIAPGTLQIAMEMQKDANGQLGEILLRMGALNSADLKEVLFMQRNLASFEDYAKSAAGVRQLLSDLFVKKTRMTADRVGAALGGGQDAREKLGEILVRRGWVSKNVVNVMLAFQKNKGDEAPASVRYRLGEILVTTEQITREQLKEALARQKNFKKKIGALVVESGSVKPQLDEYSSLKHQQTLMTAAFIAALFMANMLRAEETCAGNSQGSSSSENLTITAIVLERTSMKVMNQVQELVVTDGDIAQGYVDISAASRINVNTNNPRGYVLTFEVISGSNLLFDSISVDVGGREVQLSPSGGWIPQPYVRGGLTMDLNYRFVLSRDAQPGTYAWPLSVTARPL
jgi:hypothetical protein